MVEVDWEAQLNRYRRTVRMTVEEHRAVPALKTAEDRHAIANKKMLEEAAKQELQAKEAVENRAKMRKKIDSSWVTYTNSKREALYFNTLTSQVRLVSIDNDPPLLLEGNETEILDPANMRKYF